MHTRIPGKCQMWIRRTPTPEPIPLDSSVINYLPGDEYKPSLVILALAQFSYGRFKATLHKLRREVRLIFAEDEAELSHAVREESEKETLAGIVIADAEIMHRARRRLATAVAKLLHDADNQWTVILAFDFARQAWYDISRFKRFMKRHFPTLRWEIDRMMPFKERAVLRRPVLRKMGPRVYRRKYNVRGVVFSRVKQSDKVVVVEQNENGYFDYLIPNRIVSWATREDPDTPSTWCASGDEVFDCQMGVVDDFEEDELKGEVDGRPQSRYFSNGVDYSLPPCSDCSSMPCSSSNSWSSSEKVSDPFTLNGMDIEGEDVDEDSNEEESANEDEDIDEEGFNEKSVDEDEDIDEDEDVDDEDATIIKDEPAHSENGIDTDIKNENKDDSHNDKDNWVSSDDERSVNNPRRSCTIALHEFKNRRYGKKTGEDETLCSYLGIVGHVEDNRSLASIILGMCSVTPSH